MYLAVPSLSCGTQDLFSFFFLMQCVGSLVVACGIWFLNQELNTGPLHYDCGVLATGPPGKSLSSI